GAPYRRRPVGARHAGDRSSAHRGRGGTDLHDRIVHARWLGRSRDYGSAGFRSGRVRERCSETNVGLFQTVERQPRSWAGMNDAVANTGVTAASIGIVSVARVAGSYGIEAGLRRG